MSPQTALAFLENHVWQSTLCAISAAAISFLLRRNRAAVRHRLWVAASIKFLIPLSLFVSIGSHIEGIWQIRGSASPTLDTLEQWNEPFTPFPTLAIQPGPSPNAIPGRHFSWAPWLLLLWCAGMAVVLISSFRRWLQMRRIVQMAKPLPPGFEVYTIHRLQKAAGIGRPIPVVSSDSMIEPGLFGVFRPTLFLPSGLCENVVEEQLEAILSHEVIHARRRDNLWTMMHMTVEAIFWFNPVVWWLGSRLIDERERACDEEVLLRGCEPATYAKAMVEVCKVYLGSPLKCASGVTGATLQKRIESIMIHEALPKLSAMKVLLLIGLAVSAAGVPLLLGSMHAHRSMAAPQAADTTLSFEVATVKPHKTDAANGTYKAWRCHGSDMAISPSETVTTPLGRCAVEGFTLHDLIGIAFPLGPGLSQRDISGGPSWISFDRWDVQAKAENDAATEKELRQMLQSLIIDQFKLRCHKGQKEVQGYALVVAKNGLKIAEDKSDGPAGGMSAGSDGYKFTRNKLSSFAGSVGSLAGAPVIDKTGLAGLYTFSFQPPPRQSASADAATEASTSIFTAFQEQLGLRLEPQKVTVETIVIDSAEKPASTGSSLDLQTSGVNATPQVPKIASATPILPHVMPTPEPDGLGWRKAQGDRDRTRRWSQDPVRPGP